MPNWPPANPTEAPPFRGVPIPWPPQIQSEADQIAAYQVIFAPILRDAIKRIEHNYAEKLLRIECRWTFLHFGDLVQYAQLIVPPPRLRACHTLFIQACKTLDEETSASEVYCRDPSLGSDDYVHAVQQSDSVVREWVQELKRSGMSQWDVH